MLVPVMENMESWQLNAICDLDWILSQKGKKKNQKTKQTPKLYWTLLRQFEKSEDFLEIYNLQNVINCIKLDTRRYLFIKLTMLMPRI